MSRGSDAIWHRETMCSMAMSSWHKRAKWSGVKDKMPTEWVGANPTVGKQRKEKKEKKHKKERDRSRRRRSRSGSPPQEVN